jgi:hypothetical protein
MMITLLGGLLLMTDDPEAPTYDSNLMGITLVVVNALGFIALLFGLLALHPAIRRRWTSGEESKTSNCKIVPVANASGRTTGNQESVHLAEEGLDNTGVRSWGR